MKEDWPGNRSAKGESYVISSPLWIFVLAATISSACGGLLFYLRKAWSDESLYALVSIGGGLLLAMTLLDLLPHIVLSGSSASYMPFVLIGFLLLFLVESTMPKGEQVHKTRATSVMLGFLLHSFVEGMALVASYHIGFQQGTLLLAAMILHKIPDGVTVGSFLLVLLQKRVIALIGACSLGVATFLGAVSMYWTSTWFTGGSTGVILALSTGIFLYVSTGHLIPLIQEKSGRLPLFFFSGILAYLLLQIFPHVHTQLQV